MIIPPTARAYLAGFFDGDGCLDPDHPPAGSTSWALRVRFGQVRPDGLRFLQQHYGGEIHVRPASGTQHQPVHTYERADKPWVYRFLGDVLPYLREKRETAALGHALLAPECRDRPRADVLADLAQLEALRFNHTPLPGPPQDAPSGRHYTAWTHTHPPTAEEAGYVAGFFDAEGNLQPKYHRQRWWGLEIRFGQVSPAGLLLLQALYGGPVRLERPRGARRAQYRWELTDKAGVLAFLDDVTPYVQEKRAQTALARDVLAQPSAPLEIARPLLEQLRALNVKTRRAH